MVDGIELIQTLQPGTEEPTPRLANVKELFISGTAKVQFYGEEAVSEKEYSYLASYKPAINDTVLLLPFNGTYIVVGKLVYAVVNDEETYITTEDLNNALSAYVKTTDLDEYVSKTFLTSQLSSYSKTSHTHDQIEYRGCTAGFNVVESSTLAHFVPNKTTISLGYNSSDKKWKELVATSATIITSDLRQKNSVEKIPEVYKQLILSLEPLRYKMNEGESDRYHTGLGSQHVEKILEDLNIKSKDFAGFIKTPVKDEDGKETGDYEYALRYEEFIAPTIAVVKDNNEEIMRLKNEVLELKKIINNLTAVIENPKGELR